MGLSTERLAVLAVTPQIARDGDQERCLSATVTHRFIEAPGAVVPLRWHYVEAGPAGGIPVVLVHGHPTSWFAWSPVIAESATSHRTIAVDLKGYGQSDKRPGDWRFPAVAEEFAAFLDAIDVHDFVLAACDRGAVMCDYFVARHPHRVRRYIRIGAPGAGVIGDDHEYESWHRDAQWASDTLRDASRYLAAVTRPRMTVAPEDDLWSRLIAEFSFADISNAVPRYFQASSFAKEAGDRARLLFPKFAMPVDVIAGTRLVQLGGFTIPDVRVTELACGDFPLLENPPAIAAHIGAAVRALDPATRPQRDEPARPAYVPAPQISAGVNVVVNHDGEVEQLDRTIVTHHFMQVPGAVDDVRWHYVTAGDPRNETLVMLHGHPESWHGWRHQIDAFAERYYIVAPDLKGYGQSDKRPGDYRHEAVSEELLGLFDRLGLTQFHIIAHDRGAVQADYLGGNHPERVLSYVRMQQISHVFIPMNSPQEKIFQDPIAGPKLLSDPAAIFTRQWARFEMRTLPQWHMDRLMSEVSHPGIGEAIPRYFQSSSFLKEQIDRISRLWKYMTFPVLLLQADRDVGQPPWYFDDPARPATAFFPDARLGWVRDSGHFTTINEPEQLTAAIDDFLTSLLPPAEATLES